jgi:hypothetical protein
MEGSAFMNQAQAARVQEFEDDFVLSRSFAAHLGPGVEDWHLVETENLSFNDPCLLVFAEIGDGSRSWAACGDPAVNSGPTGSMIVEVYRADTMTLLDSECSDSGEVVLGGGDGDFLHDLLIRVYSPTARAKRPYSLRVLVLGGPYADEC